MQLIATKRDGIRVKEIHSAMNTQGTYHTVGGDSRKGSSSGGGDISDEI